MIYQGLEETDLRNLRIVQPLPGPHGGAHRRQNQRHPPPYRRRFQAGYHLRQTALKRLQIC